LEKSEEGQQLLRKLAVEDPDPQMRKEVFTQLAVMLEAWPKSEKTFVDALSLPDDELRTLAAKQCYFCCYRSAAKKLIDLAEKDSCEKTRVNAMLALSRMRILQAVPMLIRVHQDEQTSTALRQQAFRTIKELTGIQFKDTAGLLRWWQSRAGAEEYAKLPPPPSAETPAPSPPQPAPPPQAAQPAQPLPPADEKRQP
jgi:hypothetical protein